jgi:hypothetical protein
LRQGRGATLSPLGEKLVWAQARARARLLPQLENIASELNLELSRALAEHSPTLRIHASYGYAVAQLPELLRRHTRIGLDLRTSLPPTRSRRLPAVPATSPVSTFPRVSAARVRWPNTAAGFAPRTSA